MSNSNKRYMLKSTKYYSFVPSSVKKKDTPRSFSISKAENSPSRGRLNKSVINPSLPYSIKPKKILKLSPLSPLPNNDPDSKPNSSFMKSNRGYYLKRIEVTQAKSPTLMISIKKAMRNREWLFRSKPSIVLGFCKAINESNGISMTADDVCYKYYLGKGNNCGLVRQILSSRWWWVSSDESELPNVNLVWTQNTSLDFLNTIAITYYKPNQGVHLPTSITCEVPYQTETLDKISVDLSPLNFDLITKSNSFLAFKDLKQHSSGFYRTHNKIEMNIVLTDKKGLCKAMKNFYSATGKESNVPLTYFIPGIESKEFEDFSNFHLQSAGEIVWIVKPGENSNRGNGIFLSGDIKQIRENIKKSGSHCFIAQKYIERPFLINKRKFDIRLYALITSVNGVLQCYYYNEGYLRTSSQEFTTKNLTNNFIHLTNDAIQKNSEDYGKFENGNKLSYSDFQRYLDSHGIVKSFFSQILPDIKEIVKDTIKASFLSIDQKRRSHSFEILGYDFLLDSDLKPWLIEVNTNPCLELSSSILVRLIPAMLENAIRIAIDPVFPEPRHIPKRNMGGFLQEMIPENKFELIFHEQTDGKEFLDELKSCETLYTYLEDCK